MNQRDLRSARRKIQMVFQDPYSSVNPRMTIGDVVSEPWRVLGRRSHRDNRLSLNALLDRVGLATSYAHRYPHELSGGQLQRVGIARALASEPEVLVCDEPVSALDVSVQAQVLNLLLDLQEQLGLAYVFISHDLSVVRNVADHVAVMYLGQIVEQGAGQEIFERPVHPYTQALLSAMPADVARPSLARQRIVLIGEVPSPSNVPSGCRFRTRCWKARDLCSTNAPLLIDRGHDHPSSCHFAELPSASPSAGGE